MPQVNTELILDLKVINSNIKFVSASAKPATNWISSTSSKNLDLRIMSYTQHNLRSIKADDLLLSSSVLNVAAQGKQTQLHSSWWEERICIFSALAYTYIQDSSSDWLCRASLNSIELIAKIVVGAVFCKRIRSLIFVFLPVRTLFSVDQNVFSASDEAIQNVYKLLENYPVEAHVITAWDYL